MQKAILAKKVGMTQIFMSDGKLVPVTVLEAGPCTVVQKKTMDNDGYSAVQVGFGDIKIKKVSKPIKGHFDKANIKPMKVLKELKLENSDTFEVGGVIKADMFAEGDRVDISGVSKGKGYQGAIKRHNQSRGPMSHGSKYHRGIGSMGANTSPGRVMKNKKMAGHMGSENVTIQNLLVVRTDADKNLILVKGAVPGSRGTLVVLKDSVKK